MAEVSEAQSTPAPVNVIGTDAVSHPSVIRGSSAATTNAHASPTTLPPASTLIPSPSSVSSSITAPHSALPSAASHKPASASSNVGVISPLVVSSDQAVSSLEMQSSQIGMSAESSSIYNSSIISRLASEMLQNHSATTTQAHVSGQNDAPLSSSGSGTGSGSASSGKGKKSGGRKLDALMASQSSPLTIPSELSSLADPTGLESDLPGGTPHKLLQAVRSTTLPFPLPVPTYSQAVQAARASGNVSSERATIIRETVKFFLTLKYWWTTEDYDRIAELVVNEFPELRDPVAFPSAPCYGKVRLDLSMCARNIRRITKNQEKRKGSPAQNSKEPTTETVKTEPVPKPPKSGGKSRRKSSAGPSISVPTMVALSSAAQMLPHTAHTAALHSSASLQSLQDPKEVNSIPYLLTSTPPVPSTPSSTTSSSSTVLPPVAHFLGHPSGHSHGTGGIVFPSLLPITSTTPTTTLVPSTTTTTSQVAMETIRTSVDSGHEAFMDSALSLANAWRPDATLPDPLPVPPYSEKRRVRTDLSQTARNIRRREVMLKRRDSRSPEARFTAVGTVSLPPPSNQQISSDFCNELLAAASIIESRTAALHQRDVAKALELHAEVSRDPETAPSVITHTKGSEGLRPDSGKDVEESVSVSKESLPESAKYLYNYAAGDGMTGSVDNGVGLVNSQLAVIKQEVGEVGEVGGDVDHYQQQMLQAQASQAWLSAQAMSQALSMQALTSLTGLTAQALSAAHLSDHLLSSHTPTTTLSPAPPAAHQSTGSAASSDRSLSSASTPVSTQPLVQPSSYALSVPTSTSPIPLSDTSLSDASPVDRMSAMAMWRSTCLPDPLPVPPYSLNVLRARDTGNTASARPRIIRETTQFFLALKMWWTTQDYERIAELVLRQFPQLKTQNIKKDLGTCARNMRRRLPLSKTKQWAGYQSPNQSGGKDGEGMGEAGVTLGELATMASLREAQDKGRGDTSLGSLADDPRHSLLAQSVYEQNAWNVFYQQQFSTPETSQVGPPSRGNKRSLSDTTGSKAYELGEKELAEALKQAVAQSVKQLGEVDSGVRRHSVDVSEPSKNRDIKQDLAAKSVINPVPPEPSKSDNYPVMKELISHPAISVRDPKLTTESPVFPGTRTAHSGSVSEGGVGHKHPTPARAHSQPACPLRSEVPRIESQEAPMNLTCGSSSEPSKPAPKPKAIKSESKASKKGGGDMDAFTAREQVWFPHGSPWKKTGQTIIKALPTPLPVPKYSQKLMKAREEGLSYRHRSEIIRETARFYLGFKYWWSSADYSRISELVIAEFPDLKDPVSQPGQPFYRRVQRDLSMCARNLRRKNTRQSTPSSGESPPAATPKKAKSASKEKKPKKVLNIKTEAGEQGMAGTDSAFGSSSLGEVGSVLGSVMNVPTPALSLPIVTSAPSGTSLTQAILQSGVDPNLSSLPPMSSLQSTSNQSSLSVWSQPLPASSASVLPQFASAITSVPYSLPQSVTGVYSTAQSTSSSLAHSAYAATLSIPLAVSSTSSAPYADSLNKTLWAAGGAGLISSEPQTPSKTSKKRTSSQASSSKANSTKAHATAKPKSSGAQSKAVKSVAPSPHTSTAPLKSGDSSVEARAHVKNGGSTPKGKSPSSSGVATSAGSGSKKSKDGGRNLASRSGYGEGRALSNTTAIVTPTLSEAHASASSSSSANGGVSDKVYINPEHGSELRSQLTKLWQDGKFFDASLEVDNYRLPAHKLVLLAASPYLQSTFRHANPTSHLEVNLPRDTGVDAARDFLKYVYQGVLHVAPTTVHALRRIAAMLQIDQLLTYCDDYLLQLSSISSSSSSSSSGAVLQRRASLPHASSQVRRVSVNLRDPSHGQAATTEHNATTLASLTLPSSHVPVGTAHYVPSHPASARKRTSASLGVPPYGTEERNVNQTDRQQDLNVDLNRHLLPASLQQSEVDAQYGAHRPHDTHIAYPHHETHQVAHTLAKRFCSSDDHTTVDERTSLDSQGGLSYHSVVNNPAYLEGSQADGVQSIAGQLVTERGPSRGSTSVIHCGPNLINAPSHSMNQDTSTAPSVLTTTTSTMDDRSNVTDTEAMVQYYAESAEASEGVPGEEGVVVRLLPQTPVHMEVGEHAIQLDGEHAIQLDGEHAIQLSGDYQLSGHTLSEQSIQLPEGHTIQLSRQLAQHLSQHGIPLSQHLAQQISLEGTDEAVQQFEEGREGSQAEGQGIQEQNIAGMEEGEKVVIEVIQEEGQEVMVEEVIVESGDLLQDVDVAACETVECSLLPQTYCSSPETTQPLTCQVEESGEQGEEGGEQAYQNLASQWVKQQYAHTPLDADTARQFVAALQERMYGQTSSSSSIQPPPTYQETVYVQSGTDGETVYVSGPTEAETVYVGGATEGEELVVETSVMDNGGQAVGVDGDVDDGDGHASLLPQTYCSSPPRPQSPVGS